MSCCQGRSIGRLELERRPQLPPSDLTRTVLVLALHSPFWDETFGETASRGVGMKTRYRRTCLLIALLVGACAQDPNVKKQQYLQRGIAYHADGKYNEAIIQLKNALQIDPKFAPALHAIGRAYRAKSWDVDAMRELRRTVELEPDNLEARADLAQDYLV